MNEPRPGNASANHGRPVPIRGEPDLNLCRAKLAGFGDYVDCQVLNPSGCLHALGFGGGHLCLHPERHQIVARAKTGRTDPATTPPPTKLSPP